MNITPSLSLIETLDIVIAAEHDDGWALRDEVNRALSPQQRRRSITALREHLMIEERARGRIRATPLGRVISGRWERSRRRRLARSVHILETE